MLRSYDLFLLHVCLIRIFVLYVHIFVLVARSDSGYRMFFSLWTRTVFCTIGENPCDRTNSTDPPPSNTTNNSTVSSTEKSRTHVTVIISLIIVLFAVILALMVTVVIGLLYKKHRYHTRRVSDLTNFDDPSGKVYCVCVRACVHVCVSTCCSFCSMSN